MTVMPFALLFGIAAGLLTGGRVRYLGDKTFDLWPLLLLGAFLQGIAQAGFASEHAHLLVASSFAMVAAFTAANLRYAGMGVVLVGLAMNITTITVNRGMPVQAEAIVNAGIVDDVEQAARLDFKAKRHLMTDDDTMYWLSDIVPVPVLGGTVLSFGDLVLAVGVIDLVANLLHPFPRRRRHDDLPMSTAGHVGYGDDSDRDLGRVEASDEDWAIDLDDEVVDLRSTGVGERARS
jgi:hypothetical protein